MCNIVGVLADRHYVCVNGIHTCRATVLMVWDDWAISSTFKLVC